jgi:hypothetical protein
MNKTLKLVIAAGIALAAMPALAGGPNKPLAARTALKSAIAKAKHEHKTVFLAFHVSWCGWCHKLEGFLNDPKIKPIVDKHLEILWLDCMEQPNKKDLENPGVDAIVAEYHADKTGLPTMFMINGDGKTIADSIATQGGNIGFPDKPEEIAWFDGMLKKAHFSAAEIVTLDTELKARSTTLHPKPKAG